MRTTLNLDDDVVAVARDLAAARGESIGSIVSALARRGLARTVETSVRNGFPTFRVEPSAPRITSEMVRVALDEG